LDSLTSDCAGEVIDGRSPWKVDRELFIPELLASSSNLDSILIELTHWLDTRIVRLTVEDALRLEECGALELDVWRKANLSADLYETVMGLVEDALTQASDFASHGASRSIIAPYSTPQAGRDTDLVHVVGTLIRS